MSPQVSEMSKKASKGVTLSIKLDVIKCIWKVIFMSGSTQKVFRIN